jgi:hypothetical protein
MDWWWVFLALTRSLMTSDDDRWVVTLGRLDAVRAEAFATGDPRLLAEVYVNGSRAQRVDSAAIRDYARRDARVVGAELQILSCRLLSSTDRRVRLDVVDRLGAARVEWDDGTTRRLPRDLPTRRVVTLVRTTEGWRIAGST